MKTEKYRREQSARRARTTVFGLLAVAAALCAPGAARAQWATSGTTTSTTNNVGVGTAAPEQPLHVNGGSVLTTGTYAGYSFRNRGSASATDDWVWYSQGNVARFWRGGQDLLGLTADGKFGLGTTSPAARLDVVGAANIWSGDRHAVNHGNMAAGTLTIGNTAANFGGGTGWNANTAGLMLEASDNTEIAVHDYGSRVASFMYYEGGTANRLSIGRDMGFGGIGTVSLNGSVGVGTNAPAKRLDVNGSIFAGNSISLGKGVTNYSGIGFNRDVDVGTILDPTRAAYQVHREVNGNKLMFTAYDGAGTFLGYSLVFDPSGNAGVGTQSPAYRFDVQGGQVNASGGLCIAGDCKSSWAQVGGAGQWTTSGSNLLYNTGNVGIATQATGTAKLVIGGTPGAEGLDLATSDQYANLRVIRNSNSTFDKDLYLQYGAGAGSKIRFYNDNAERMTLVGGKLGVGTTAPATALHVVGDVTVTGALTAKYQDVAEWVPTKQQLAAATVVVLDRAELNHVRASAAAYDTGVAGVISVQPGIALGERGEGKVLVATTGRVKVKVDATRGTIRVGDLLVTSDVSGVAMKSQPLELGGVPIHRPGTIIGKALEPLEKGTGEILVLLSLQ